MATGNDLVLEAPPNPVPVKKQPKYNLHPLASSAATTSPSTRLPLRLASALPPDASDEDWRTPRLWSSDFRTHITERRWTAFRAELDAFLARSFSPPAAQTPGPVTVAPAVDEDARHILIETPSPASCSTSAAASPSPRWAARTSAR